MGACVTRNTPANIKCNICSKGLGDKGRKHFILCSNGHSVCTVCQVKTGDQYMCPHCQTQIISIKAIEINRQFDEFKRKAPELSALRSQKDTIINQTLLHSSRLRDSLHQPRIIRGSLEQAKIRRQETLLTYLSQLDQGFTRMAEVDVPKPKQENVNQQPQQAEWTPTPDKDKVQPNQEILQQPKTIKLTDLQLGVQVTAQQKICGCSFQGFLLFLVLLIQIFLTLANMYYTYIEPHCQCMDSPHLHPLLIFRPLLMYVSGVQIVLFVFIVVSALIYKIGCMSQSIFDKWIVFLKTLLGLKQLLWVALMVFLQITIMPDYCSIQTTRFSLISAIVNGISFLMLVAKPINSCFCPTG